MSLHVWIICFDRFDALILGSLPCFRVFPVWFHHVSSPVLTIFPGPRRPDRRPNVSSHQGATTALPALPTPRQHRRSASAAAKGLRGGWSAQSPVPSPAPPHAVADCDRRWSKGLGAKSAASDLHQVLLFGTSPVAAALQPVGNPQCCWQPAAAALKPSPPPPTALRTQPLVSCRFQSRSAGSGSRTASPPPEIGDAKT